LSLTADEIVELIQQFEKDTKAMREDVLRICWYMRGSISYDEGVLLTKLDREIINSIIKDNVEITKETKLPLI
jgi:hypothetical protein